MNDTATASREPDFENRGTHRTGFISINVPGGFESRMPHIVQALTANPVGDAAQ